MSRSSAHPTARRATPRGRATALLLSGLLGTGAVLSVAGPAAAHDRLESTNPADGTTVDVAPEAVALTMSSSPLALGTQVQVTGPDGSVVSAGDPQIVDETVTEAITGPRAAGTYQVQWRITSSDGHPVSGTFAFTATTAAPGGEQTTEPTGSTSTSTATPSSSTSTTGPDAGGLAGTGNGALIGIAAAAVVVVGGVGGIIGYRRRQR